MKLKQWSDEAIRRIEAATEDDGYSNVRDIVECVTGWDYRKQRFFADREIDSVLPALEELMQRRMNGEPLQYLTGSTGFMHIELKCDKRALIPRQDTETLCEAALMRLKRNTKIWDMCCGTGAIGLALASERGDCSVLLSDISSDALSLAMENAARLQLNNVRFAKGDLFAACEDRFDMIVCNPPYLTQKDMEELQKEVTYEPKLALYGGKDGLDFYRRIASEAAEHLIDRGFLLLEVGAGQAEDVALLLEKEFDAELIRDINGIERVVCARKKG